MTDVIIILIVAVIVGAAGIYVWKAKKRGGCIGCPDAKNCAGARSADGCSSCGGTCAKCSGSCSQMKK